ncbi:MAG: hypothetical protein Q8N89_06990 [Azonexus sp.]|nr:hypothetical protein [Azonexus sp.]
MKAIVHSRCGVISTLLVVATCWAFPAYSDEAPFITIPAENEVQLGGTVADADILEQSRGGAELNLYDIKSDGVVRDNQAYNLSTGSNYIAEGSFAGAAGFATVVQNSGNNVLIQNATIINVRVQ